MLTPGIIVHPPAFDQDLSFEQRVDGEQFGPQIASAGPDTIDIGGTPVLNALKFHPVVWQAQTLYCIEADIRMESSENDPPDVLVMLIDVPTNEQITSHFITQSAQKKCTESAFSRPYSL